MSSVERMAWLEKTTKARWKSELKLLLQVKHLDTSEKSELHKLQLLKDEQGLVVPIFYSIYHIHAAK